MATEVTNSASGVIAAGGILDRIVKAKAVRLERARRELQLDELKEAVGSSPRVSQMNSLRRVLASREGIAVIAELKRRSPSKGIIREDYNPVAIAREYVSAGAAAISVLTEEDFFDGSLDHLRSVRRAEPDVPLLRKDFVFDEYQLYEAAEAGASAVLLIVAILSDPLLKRLITCSAGLGLDALVEVHTESEFKRALAAGARIVGVNNRDLTTFSVDRETSLRIAALAPASVMLVSESGINSRNDIEQLSLAGFRGVLIGEHLMRANDPGQRLKALLA